MAFGNLDARHFWQSQTEKSLQQVQKGCAEWNALTAYFGKHMPSDSKMHVIERVENPKLWNLYETHLGGVKDGFPGEPEMWLWHGADDIAEIIDKGLKTAYSNRAFNMCGVLAGLSFAALQLEFARCGSPCRCMWTIAKLSTWGASSGLAESWELSFSECPRISKLRAERIHALPRTMWKWLYSKITIHIRPTWWSLLARLCQTLIPTRTLSN